MSSSSSYSKVTLSSLKFISNWLDSVVIVGSSSLITNGSDSDVVEEDLLRFFLDFFDLFGLVVYFGAENYIKIM